MRKDVLLEFEYFAFIGFLYNGKLLLGALWISILCCVSSPRSTQNKPICNERRVASRDRTDTRIFAFQYDYTCTLRSTGPILPNISYAFLSILRMKPYLENVIRFLRFLRCLPSDRLDFAVPASLRSRGFSRYPLVPCESSFKASFFPRFAFYLLYISAFIEAPTFTCVHGRMWKGRRPAHARVRTRGIDRSSYILYELYVVKFKQATLLDGFRVCDG